MIEIPVIFTLISTFVSIFVTLPIGIISISALCQASTNVLAAIPSGIAQQYTIDQSIMIGFSSFFMVIILCGSFFVYNEILKIQSSDSEKEKLNNQNAKNMIKSLLLIGLSISGVSICGTFLSTIDQIKSQKTFVDLLTFFTINDKPALEMLLNSESGLIAGVVIFSAVILGLIGSIIYFGNQIKN